MNIGIITFHAPHNRGSMLQAYAIQNVVKRLRPNDSVEIIDFSNSKQKDMYALLRKVDSFRDILYNCFKLIFYRKFKQYFKDFIKFRLLHFHVTYRNYKTYTELQEIGNNYDCIIAGSDQIWNTLCYDADDAYFLGWSDCKNKIAYAPSFGANNLNLLSNKHFYREWMNQFNFISIRENNGRAWIKELIGRDVDVLLDPTLLIERNEWEKLANEDLILPDKFIYFYTTHYRENVCKFVEMYAHKLNLPVYITDIKNWVLKGRRYGFKLANHGGPNAFLTLIKKATFVFTSSFHGSAFSVIFQKEFYYLDDGKRRASDDRALTLIEDMGLMSRFKNVDSDELNMEDKINYNAVNRKLALRKEDSVMWLKNALNSLLSSCPD